MPADRPPRRRVVVTGLGAITPLATNMPGTWQALNQGLATTNIRSLAQSRIDPKVWYVGTNGSGLYRSKDGGETWTPLPVRASAAKR